MSVEGASVETGFIDRVQNLLDQIEYRRADTQEQREAIFKLRYDAYVREGAIDANSTMRLTDALDTSPNMWIFGLHMKGELVSSIRLSIVGRGYSEMPAAQVFPDILGQEIADGLVFVDPTRFVTNADAARRYPELPYITLRLAFLAGGYFKADYVLATVRREHQAFYKRVFRCSPVCPPRMYPTLTKPVSLMKVHYPTMSVPVIARYPFFGSTEAERSALFDRPDRAQSAA